MSVPLHTQTHCDLLSVWSVRDLCSNEMHTGLYLVRATALKQRLETAADSTANKLLDQIQTMARDSNDHVCETYTHMAAGVSVVCHVDSPATQSNRQSIQFSLSMAGMPSTEAVVLLLMLLAILPLGLQQAVSRYDVNRPLLCLGCKTVQTLPTAPPCSVSSPLV